MNFEFHEVNREANYEIDVIITSDAYTTHTVNKNAYLLNIHTKDKEKINRYNYFYSMFI